MWYQRHTCIHPYLSFHDCILPSWFNLLLLKVRTFLYMWPTQMGKLYIAFLARMVRSGSHTFVYTLVHHWQIIMFPRLPPTSPVWTGKRKRARHNTYMGCLPVIAFSIICIYHSLSNDTVWKWGTGRNWKIMCWCIWDAYHNDSGGRGV